MGKITEYPSTELMENTDKFFINSNGELKQISLEDLQTIVNKVEVSTEYSNKNSKMEVHNFKCYKMGRLCQIVFQFSLSSSVAHNELLLNIPDKFKPIAATISAFMYYDSNSYAKNITLENNKIQAGAELQAKSWYSGYFTYISAQ